MAGINYLKTWWQKIAGMLAEIEKLAVAVCLGGMVVLVLIQIILRNFYNSGIVGSDSLVKHLVLWVGFLGAGLATREKSHIRIDIASKVLPPKARAIAQIFVDVFSITVCIGLCTQPIHLFPLSMRQEKSCRFFRFRYGLWS